MFPDTSRWYEVGHKDGQNAVARNGAESAVREYRVFHSSPPDAYDLGFLQAICEAEAATGGAKEAKLPPRPFWTDPPRLAGSLDDLLIVRAALQLTGTNDLFGSDVLLHAGALDVVNRMIAAAK